MAITIQTGELGYSLEIDGLRSEAHRFDHAVITKGPSGALYGALVEDGFTGKPQVYKLVPVESIHLDEQLEEDVDGGYVEDGLYDDEEEEEEGEEEGEGEEGEDDEDDEDDGVKVEVEAATDDE